MNTLTIAEILETPAEPATQNTQAERVIAKFGSAYRLAKLLNRNPSSVYRWTHPKARGGTGGIIPAAAMRELLKIARVEGVLLTPADLDPRPRHR